MMKKRSFKQVDVFTGVPYLGNPVAVVLEGQGLSGEEMQRFARWTRLSETTFVLPPDDAAQADYRVRIFTPGGELPFAGHPTLGTCHAWLEAGGRPRARGGEPSEVVQQCGIGLVRLRRGAGAQLAFAAPPCTIRAPAPALLAKTGAALGLQQRQIVAARLLDNGPVWIGLLLDSVQTVLALAPDHAALKNLGYKVGVAALLEEAASRGDSARSVRLEVRAFAAAIGVPEDPVTGSLNASLAQWLIAEGRLPMRYRAAQGQCLGRAGCVQVERDDARQLWIGGESISCVAGTVML